jgi:hypothetical protein
MRSCPETDAIVTIAEMLNWNVAAGLQHLQTCTDCRARIEALQLARAALTETETVDAATIARITAVVETEARNERARGHTAERWASALEAVLAGITAPLVLVSSNIELGSVAAGVLTFVLGAAFLVYGRRLRLYDS